MITNMILGAVAGLAAAWVMGQVTSTMYQHEDRTAREAEDEARDGKMSYGIAAEKAAHLMGRELSDQQRKRYGTAIHWGIALAAGAMYGALRDRVPGLVAGRGLAFGTGFFLLVDEGANTLLGLTPPPQAFPWQAHARGLVGHLVYGVTTEALLELADTAGHAAKKEAKLIDPWNAMRAGISGGVIMALLLTLARAMGVVEFSLARYEGGMLSGRTEGGGPWLAGIVMHLVLSALIALAYAWAFATLWGRANWYLGMVLGVIHWITGGIAFPALDAMNVTVREGKLGPVGAFGSSRGSVMILGMLMTHLLYGLVVGWLYSVPDAFRRSGRRAAWG
ncbi:MAG TPA: DUF1440 domain-containing protein [Trueperaceae bacterium]